MAQFQYGDTQFIMEYETYDMEHMHDYDDTANGYATFQRSSGDGSPLETKVRKGMEFIGIQFVPQWEFAANGGPKFADFCITTGRKLVVEVYGDETHCNPEQYPANYCNQYDRYAAHVWAYDDMRIRRLTEMQYPTIVLWGHEINKDLNGCIDRILRAITSFSTKSFDYSYFTSLNWTPLRIPSAEELTHIPLDTWMNKPVKEDV